MKRDRRRGDARLKAAWGSAVRVDDDLWRVRLRNPRGGLQVNTYVHHGDGRWVVIDPGWPWTLDALEAALRALGASESRARACLAVVDAWLYTHTHVDHMGAAALLARRSEGRHVVLGAVGAHLPRWHRFQDEVSDWSPWIRATFEEGPREKMLACQAAEPTLVGEFGVAGVERVDFCEAGGVVEAGAMRLEVMATPGHDPYHVAFWEQQRGWLFSGDMVIAAPTPILRSMGGDLGAYEASLSRLEELQAAVLLPGHGLHRAGGAADLFGRSRAFVEDYRAEVGGELARGGAPRSVYEVALALAPQNKEMRHRGRWWVHLGLVDVHLRALAARGVAAVMPGEPARFGPM